MTAFEHYDLPTTLAAFKNFAVAQAIFTYIKIFAPPVALTALVCYILYLVE